jgi:hypothetical protein
VAEIELFVFLFFAVAVLAGLGLRSGVPYPSRWSSAGWPSGSSLDCRRPS